MPEQQKGAKEDVPPPSQEESAKLAESLKAAQDSAEVARKKNEELEAQIEERDAQITDFQDKLKDFEAKLAERDNGKKGTKSAKELSAILRKQAENGDQDAQAVLEAAREIAREEYGTASDEAKLQDSYDRSESFMEKVCKERNWTQDQFIKNVDQHAKYYMHLLPHAQFEAAYSAYLKDEGLISREAAITTKEKELGLWKDGGTQQTGPEGSQAKKDGEKHWRDDKTANEKRNRLAEL